MNATKDIPAGKILVAEYGTYGPEEHSETTVIEQGFSPRLQVEIGLVSISPGFKPAGSRALWTNGGFAVLWTKHGAGQGQHHKTEAEAKAHFDKLMLTHAAGVTPTFHGDEHCASCFCGWFMKGGATAMATMAADHNAMAGA